MNHPMESNPAVAIRLYSGWSYVSLRLGAEVVEYEESGASTRECSFSNCLDILLDQPQRTRKVHS